MGILRHIDVLDSNQHPISTKDFRGPMFVAGIRGQICQQLSLTTFRRFRVLQGHRQIFCLVKNLSGSSEDP
jgi:hypothetical protein